MFERSRETIESVLEKTLFASRWLLAPFYLGLAISIAILLIKFVQELFHLLHEEPQCLPTEWRQQAEEPGTPATARVVADYIAGMTDRFALSYAESLD